MNIIAKYLSTTLKRAALSCAVVLAITPVVEAEFSGPIFGLAKAPNGDILVADAGAGVIELKDGSLLQSVPTITDIATIGKGSLWVTRNGGGDGITDDGQALLRVSKGHVKVLVNLYEFEANFNPQTDDVRSNPFDVYSLGGNAALVVDSAGNDLLHVNKKGHVEVVAIFPTRMVSTVSLKDVLGCPESALPPCFLPPMMPAQAVPTSVVVGKDGYYYVSELRGFPGPLDQSRIWRIAPWASWADCATSTDCEVVFDGGFTSIIDLAFGPDGRLYVAEFDEAGWFTAEVLHLGVGGTINACDLESLECEEVATEIPFLTAIAFGKKGQLWATRNAIIPPLASVEKINLP